MPGLKLGLRLRSSFTTAGSPPSFEPAFYVSSTGDDNNSGLSPTNAWRSVAAVNEYASTVGFEPGDKILFEGGQVFELTSALEIVNHLHDDPIVIGSYGEERATLKSLADRHVILFFESSGIIENLNIEGFPWNTATLDAVLFYSQGSPTQVVRNCRVSNCSIKGGVGCLTIGTYNLDCRFENFLVENLSVSDSKEHGILTYAQNRYSHRNITIRNIESERIHGVSGGDSSGDHIVLGGCVDSLIENCRADGAVQTAAHDHNLIWVYDTNNTVIRNCTAGNASGTGTDRGGFGIDVNCNDCRVEYCYAFNCHGQGILIMNGSRNVARFNLIVNCAKNYGHGIYVYGCGIASAVTTNAIDFSIYNNTVVLGVSTSGTHYCLNVRRPGDRGLVVNNILRAGIDAIRNVLLDNSPNANLRFYGNSYSRPAGALSLKGTTQYAGLTAWRGQGFESLNSSSVGFEGDPLFDSEGLGLEAYRLQSTSFLYKAGLGLAQFSLSATVDFFGRAVDAEDLSVGAIDASADDAAAHVFSLDFSKLENSGYLSLPV